MAESDPAEASFGALSLLLVVLVAMNSTAQVLGSELVAVEQTPPLMEAAAEEKQQCQIKCQGL